MNPAKFARIAESLRQYRRAELKDFETEIVGDPLESLYVDPLQGDAILQTMLSSNTTFILGRKGTGKSTVFGKAQSEIRRRGDLISIYIDVKALYDTINATEVPVSELSESEISSEIYRSHMLRKSFLAAVLSELANEVKQASENMSVIVQALHPKEFHPTGMLHQKSEAEQLHPKAKRADLCCYTKPTLDPQPSTERMKIMLNHNLNLANSEQRTENSEQLAAGTAKVAKNKTRNLDGTGRTTISNALRRRAQAVIKDKSIDAQSRALIRYGLEINDPWLPELVRRADAGETIIYTVNSLKHPHTARGY